MPDFQLTRDQAIPDSNPTDHEISRVTCPTCGGQGQIMPANPWEGPTPTERAGIRAMDPEQTVEFLEEARRAYEEELALKAHEEELTVDPRLREKLQTTARTLFGGGSVYPEALQCLGEYGVAWGS
jgi:hypothetical protein